MTMKMPMINECSMSDCAYNSDMNCHALAITVGGPSPLCDTYLKSDQKGGDGDSVGAIGACKVGNCMYNTALECSSDNVKIGMHADHAECDTFREMM